MTNIKLLFRNSFLALTLLTVGVPVAFAATDTTTTVTPTAPRAVARQAAAQQDEGFDWGWLGLLGLIGLVGLRGGSKDR